MASELVRMWAHRSIGEARELLASPDVTVTNQADKELQLLKLLELDSLVSEAFASCAEAERKGGARPARRSYSVSPSELGDGAAQ